MANPATQEMWCMRQDGCQYLLNDAPDVNPFSGLRFNPKSGTRKKWLGKCASAQRDGKLLSAFQVKCGAADDPCIQWRLENRNPFTGRVIGASSKLRSSINKACKEVSDRRAAKVAKSAVFAKVRKELKQRMFNKQLLSNLVKKNEWFRFMRRTMLTEGCFCEFCNVIRKLGRTTYSKEAVREKLLERGAQVSANRVDEILDGSSISTFAVMLVIELLGKWQSVHAKNDTRIWMWDPPTVHSVKNQARRPRSLRSLGTHTFTGRLAGILYQDDHYAAYVVAFDKTHQLHYTIIDSLGSRDDAMMSTMRKLTSVLKPTPDTAIQVQTEYQDSQVEEMDKQIIIQEDGPHCAVAATLSLCAFLFPKIQLVRPKQIGRCNQSRWRNWLLAMIVAATE